MQQRKSILYEYVASVLMKSYQSAIYSKRLPSSRHNRPRDEIGHENRRRWPFPAPKSIRSLKTYRILLGPLLLRQLRRSARRASERFEHAENSASASNFISTEKKKKTARTNRSESFVSREPHEASQKCVVSIARTGAVAARTFDISLFKIALKLCTWKIYKTLQYIFLPNIFQRKKKK